ILTRHRGPQRRTPCCRPAAPPRRARLPRRAAGSDQLSVHGTQRGANGGGSNAQPTEGPAIRLACGPELPAEWRERHRLAAQPGAAQLVSFDTRPRFLHDAVDRQLVVLLAEVGCGRAELDEAEALQPGAVG